MGNTTSTQIKLSAAMLTDVGLVRDHNEDSAYVDEENHRHFIVADGMGGHAAGEVASAMAVEHVHAGLDAATEELLQFIAAPDDEGRKRTVATLESAVQAAHEQVYKRGLAEPDKQGMGTTLDVVLVAGPEAFVAHVGDSRTYLVRDGKATQITTDHTVAEVLVIEGKLSVEEAKASQLSSILVNAIGVGPDVGVELAHVQLRTGDSFLLCSDGLHEYFTEQQVAELILGSSPEEALEAFIEQAKAGGGRDNITGVIIHVDECEGTGGPSDGVIRTAAAVELSDGIPAAIDRDDTLPVDVDDPPSRSSVDHDDADDDAPAAHRTTDPAVEAVDETPSDEDANDENGSDD